MIVKRCGFCSREYSSCHIESEEKENFYGERIPLKWKYIKDKTNGGKLGTYDCEFIGFGEDS